MRNWFFRFVLVSVIICFGFFVSLYADPLTIAPSSALDSYAGDWIRFTASGGTGSYTWSVSGDAGGTMSVPTGATSTYYAPVEEPTSDVIDTVTCISGSETVSTDVTIKVSHSVAGDFNNDGICNLVDLNAIIDMYLSQPEDVDLTDVSIIINIILWG